VVKTPYCAVANISDISDGTVEGIFAFPVDGPQQGELNDEKDPDLGAWEPDTCGIYYLGKDFKDVVRRKKWVLC
jgi:hypothetical protein